MTYPHTMPLLLSMVQTPGDHLRPPAVPIEQPLTTVCFQVWEMEKLGREEVGLSIPMFLALDKVVVPSEPQNVMRRIHQKDGKHGEQEAGARTFVSSIGKVVFTLKVLPFF